MFESIFNRIFIGILLFAALAFDLFRVYSNKELEGTDANYINSYYVMTKDVDNDKISYYEASNSGEKRHRRKTEKFDNVDFDEIVNLDHFTCFDSYINREKNKVLNKYLDDCQMINQDNENVSGNEIYQQIAKQIGLLEHEMFDIKIYKINDEYYVVRDLNVNFYIPYELYKYNNIDNKLELICIFDDEEIIGFRKNEKSQFTE